MLVDDNIIIGKDTKIWHPEMSNIYGTGYIRGGCNIGTFVEIRSPKIGHRCKIQSFTFIPEGVVIGDDVFIGPHVCFTNDKYPSAEKFGKWSKTYVESGVSIGANSTIVCGITIGSGAVIGAGSVVTKNIPPGITVVGNPAKELKKNE